MVVAMKTRPSTERANRATKIRERMSEESEDVSPVGFK